MGRYRVLQMSKTCFRPQAKHCFSWYGFGLFPYVPEKTFAHLEDAEMFIEAYINEHETEKYPKVVRTW